MRRDHSQQHHKKAAKSTAKPHKPKKKGGFFYKIVFFLALLILIVLSYFVILVSTEPKSIPYVTNAIESALQKKFGDDLAISNSYISFTRYGTFKVTITSLKILYTLPNATEKRAFIIPTLDSEFSLLNLVLLRFHPSKMKVSNPDIIVDDLKKLQEQSAAIDTSATPKIPAIIKLLSSIRKGEIPIKNLEVENARLLIKSEDNSVIKHKILVKKSKINSAIQGKALNISSVNKIEIDDSGNDIDLNSNCQLSKQDGLKCDLVLENFIPSSVIKLHSGLDFLGKINAKINGSASLVIKDGKMQNVVFQAKANKGYFEFPDFFSQRMFFSDFSLKGEYDDNFGILNLTEINGDIISKKFPSQKQPLKSHFGMSLLISGLKDPETKKFDFYIGLQNVTNDEIEKFWPSALSEAGIRNWVIKHVSGGMIKNAYAKFSLVKDSLGNHLTNMNSEVVFSDFNLVYDEHFPPITKVEGIANFTKSSMKISISKGSVLDSTISDSVIAIDNFADPVAMLKISGKSQGNPADGIKHADYKSDFANEIEKYLNGNATNDFDIRIPLRKKIAIRDIYIAVNSTIAGLDNEYVRGGVIVHSKKDFRSNNFVTKIDLTASELVSKALDIEKKSLVESGLDFVVSVKDLSKISINNISLWKKEEKKPEVKRKTKGLTSKQQIGPQFETLRVSGDVEFEIHPLLITSANIRNNNFGKNNYVLSYKVDKQKGLKKLLINAQKFNLGALIENKFFKKFENYNSPLTSQIQVSALNVELMHNKSIKNFTAALACKNNFCYSGAVRGNYNRKQGLSLRTIKKPKEKFIRIEGRITDVGYIAEGLGISKTISGGNAKIELQTKMVNKKQFIEGETRVDSNMTFYENPTVKRLAKNDLFSQIKDKIFSSEKTTFNFVKVEFDFSAGILNLKSLVANNYKIGITAKGVLDLKNDTCQIRGMIVPGFLINNLFGIGNIPILRNILTGGEGGGLFGIRYTYVKNQGDKEGTFDTNAVSSFVPSTIQNLFD